MIYPIVTVEHGPHAEVLTQIAEPVSFPLSDEDKAIIQEMKQRVMLLKGVGLAAPQIGVAKKIIVYVIDNQAKAIRKDGQEEVPLTVLINPTYQPTQDAERVADWEACFSVSETTGKVPRYSRIQYRAQTEDGSVIEAVASGFTARVLQHEIDHIQGTLILDRLTPECVQGTPQAMMALRIKEMPAEHRNTLRQTMLEAKQNNPHAERLAYIEMVLKLLDTAN